ncbi:MAG: NADH dehydrogenase [Acidimicrobiales bacterium]|nr:MAG: NADH dehydrogenase [Acidimicrobiales bacterium]
MVRSFEETPLPDEVVFRVVDAGRRAPSAGNTWGVHFLVLRGREECAAYWECTLPEHRRGQLSWPGLLRAPVLVVVWVDPAEYRRRYRLPDKRRSGGPDGWTVPFWFVDAGMAVENMLLAAVDEGLGALFCSVFGGESALRARFGVPESMRAVGTVVLGHPSPDDRPSLSQRRGRPPLEQVAHLGGW